MVYFTNEKEIDFSLVKFINWGEMSATDAAAESIIIEFIATGGNTPILARRKYKLKKTYNFSRVISFLRQQLKKSESFDNSSGIVSNKRSI